MISATASLLLFASLAFNSLAQENETSTERFPASSAIAEGLSPDALAKLDKLVQSFVDDDDIVGAELLVIKNGKSILHESYGWRDIKAEVKMENDSVFCVRSMTKPLIGASILMLLDDNLLELDDLVSKYLPSFDVEGSRKITIEHLLTHTSGLPMSLIANSNLEDLEGIQAVAKLGAGYELGFEPGSAINYSDQGTDMLTAVLEVASGMTAAEFVRTRLLDPLGMQSSACLMEEENPLRARGCSKYIGSGGTWTEFWNTEKPPLFPFFLGSQGLYSTLEDYARFMEFWLRKGRVGKDRLLGSRYVRKALTPSAYPLGGSTGFPGLTTNYGFLMELWSQEDADGEKEVVVYGHTGSDGTHAWAFPEQKAMVLYFTQTRGTITGLQVEEAL
ncbi:MAG: CubicO group peptidase (beta-lactamase class C family), partial [Planctomycetota bacterium]